MQDNREKPVVLVMDDEAAHREFAQAFFKNEGYRVKLAETYAQAREVIHDTNELMVLFADIHMQGDAAHEIFSYVREKASHRIIAYAWTGDTSWETYAAATKAGAFRVLHKMGHPMDVILNHMGDDIRLIRTYGQDDLTGLENMRGFVRSVKPELEDMRDRRHNEREGDRKDRRKSHMDYAGIVVLDANRLKIINDVLGHLKGDEAIIAIANALRKHIRSAHHACRKSGDEFLIWLPGFNLAQACRRGQFLTSAISTVEFTGKDGEPWPLSAFFGAASIHVDQIGEDAEETLLGLIDRADQELLRVKARRNLAEGKLPGER